MEYLTNNPQLKVKFNSTFLLQFSSSIVFLRIKQSEIIHLENHAIAAIFSEIFKQKLSEKRWELNCQI